MPQLVGLLWTSDQLVAETYLTTHNTYIRQTSMPPVGFKPTISTGERPQTYALDHAANGTGTYPLYTDQKYPKAHMSTNYSIIWKLLLSCQLKKYYYTN